MSNHKFVYKEHDEEGLITLDAIAQTHQFNKWMYQAIKPYLKGDILEIGSGIGNITQYVLDDKFSITASDIRASYCNILRKRFKENPFLAEVRTVDIVHSDFENEYKDMLNKFDCIFALNAIEHIEDHSLAVANCSKLLKANGRLIILVPAFQQLYNSFDRELHHFRRYTKSSLEQLLAQRKFSINTTKYFNAAGIFGWWFSGKLLKNNILPPGQLSLFNKLVPLFKIVDELVMKKVGLSLISVGDKK